MALKRLSLLFCLQNVCETTLTLYEKLISIKQKLLTGIHCTWYSTQHQAVATGEIQHIYWW